MRTRPTATTRRNGPAGAPARAGQQTTENSGELGRRTRVSPRPLADRRRPGRRAHHRPSPARSSSGNHIEQQTPSSRPCRPRGRPVRPRTRTDRRDLARPTSSHARTRGSPSVRAGRRARTRRTPSASNGSRERTVARPSSVERLRGPPATTRAVLHDSNKTDLLSTLGTDDGLVGRDRGRCSCSRDRVTRSFFAVSAVVDRFSVRAVWHRQVFIEGHNIVGYTQQ